jgi:uncharacterized membrane protein
MNSTYGIPDRLNRRLAWLLGVGSWVSCGLIAIGMMLRASGFIASPVADHLVVAGIVLLIALPTMRVIAMGAWFVLHRDPDFALIAALVLVIIIASTLFGISAA